MDTCSAPDKLTIVEVLSTHPNKTISGNVVAHVANNNFTAEREARILAENHKGKTFAVALGISNEPVGTYVTYVSVYMIVPVKTDMDGLNTKQIAVIRCNGTQFMSNMFARGRFYHGFKETGREDNPNWWVIDNMGHRRCVSADNNQRCSFGSFELVGVVENNLAVFEYNYFPQPESMEL